MTTTRSQSRAQAPAANKKFFYKSKNGKVIKELNINKGNAFKEKKQMFYLIKNFDTSKYEKNNEGLYKEKIQNIVFKNVQELKLKYNGKPVIKHSFIVKKPAGSEEIENFISNYIKNITNIGLYYISSNFEGIGWRSSKKLEPNGKVRIFNPDDFEIYNDNNDIDFNQEIIDFNLYILQK